jgi:hypothetical protein
MSGINSMAQYLSYFGFDSDASAATGYVPVLSKL